uniref:CYCLIN domain-containing protein n=1 Tax=Angiostrongylus costaricensis TaxID=334426 RepID=A0A158PGZ9_ANGCS
LENDAFRKLEAGLNDNRYHQKDAPPQLTALKCTGIGSPKKVWGLLCRKNELVRPSNRLLDNHPDLSVKTRAVLVDWIMEVCSSEKQHRETFHLAIDYVDRFLGKFCGVKSCIFQLVGTAALFLASKYEEIYPPKLEEFVAYTDGACNEYDVRTFEIIMLKELEWSLSALTSIHWLKVQLYRSLYENFLHIPNSNKHVTDQPFIVPDTLREDFFFLYVCNIHFLILLRRSLQLPFFSPVVEWVEPVVKVCDRLRSHGDPIVIVDGVRADDLHNIQTHPEQDFEEIIVRHCLDVATNNLVVWTYSHKISDRY